MDSGSATPKPMIIAHRGASAHRPENTIAAYDKAMGEQAEGIEIDLQLSKDGVPVVFHDRTLSKLGESSRYVSDYTVDELKALDAGGWYAKKYKGQEILTLDEVLSKYGMTTQLLLEIKVRARDRELGIHKTLMAKVVQAVGEHKLGKRVHILSFDEEALRIGRETAPRLRYTMNVKEMPDPPEIDSAWQPLFGVSFNIDILDESIVRELHASGKIVMTYTCNDHEQVDKALAAGVDLIMTDDPGWLLNALKARGVRD